MAAINVVRFRVKPGREAEFVEAHRNMEAAFPGIRRAWLVKTGDRTYCIVGLWRDQDALAGARSAMIANLDKFRDCLEDLGGGMGVTDPVSGEAIVEMGGKGGKEGKKGREGRGPRERGAAATPSGGGRGGGGGGGAAPGAGGGGGAAADVKRAERRAQRIKERTGGAGGGKAPEKRRERER